MSDTTGQSAANHEGVDSGRLSHIPSYGCDDVMDDLQEPITYQLFVQKIVEVEQRMRQEQAMKRRAFEERVQMQYRKELDEIRAQVADLLVKPMSLSQFKVTP